VADRIAGRGYGGAMAELRPDAQHPPDGPVDGALPSASQLDELEADLDRVDAVLAQLDEDR
jgi:hypothetical protein